MRSDLLDRDAETAALSAALSPSARPGRGSVVLISGPLGIGRSALLNLAGNLAVAAGMRAERVAGARFERNFGLCLARELLGPLLPVASGADKESAHDVIARSALSGTSVLLGQEEAHGEHRMALDSVALAVEAATRRRPVALLVDDLQWSDEPSLRVLARVALLARIAPVTLVMTILDGDAGGDRPLIREITALAETILRPGPLSRASTRDRVLETRLPDASALAERLTRESGGIPLLLAAGLAEAAGKRAGGEPGVKVSVREQVGATLAAQSAVVQRYALVAAVVGEGVDPEVIGRLVDLDPVEAVRVQSALARLGLSGPRAARLTRGHLRDSAQEWLSVQEQETLRLRAAAMLYEGGTPAEQIVITLPFIPLSAPWVSDLILSAADAARASGDMGTAARCLRLALRATDPPASKRGALLAQLAAAEHALGEVAAIRHLSDAMLSMPDPGEAVAVAVHLPAAAFASAPDWFHDQLVAAAARLPAWTRPGQAPIRLSIAARLLSAGQERLTSQPLLDWVAGVAPEPELPTSADRELEAVRLREDTLAVSRPAQEVAVRIGRLVAREPVSPAQIHSMLPLILTSWYAAENVPSGLAWLEAVATQPLAHPSQADELSVLALRAALRLRHGYLARAVSLTERACAEISHDVRCQGRFAGVFYGVALTARDGRLSRTVLSAFRPRDDYEGLVELALRQLLEASLALAHTPHQAVARVEDCGRRLEQAGCRNPALFPWRLWAACLHRRVGQTELAMSRISEEISLAQAWGSPASVSRALRARARAAPARNRLEYLTAAHELVAESPDQLERAKVLLALAEAMPTGDAAVAGFLREVMALAERCGLAGLVARNRERLAREGVMLGGDAASLTQAERRVALLAARGATNSAIATEFGITRRAVEKHLSSCYRKLGIEGRIELAAVLGDSGSQQQEDGPVAFHTPARGLGAL